MLALPICNYIQSAISQSSSPDSLEPQKPRFDRTFTKSTRQYLCAALVTAKESKVQSPTTTYLDETEFPLPST